MHDLEQSTIETIADTTIIEKMSVRVRKNNLLKSLTRAQGISEKKTINPNFSNIILTAKNNRLFLSSSNININLDDNIIADVQSVGVVSVNTNMLYEICRKLPDSNEINIEQLDTTLSIKSSNAFFKIPIFEHQNKNKEGDTDIVKYSISLENNVLRDIFNKTYFAISNDEVRYYLCGIYFEILEDRLIAVTTDGHRLSCIENTIKQESLNIEDYGVIVPKKTITELIKMLKDEEGTINISVFQNKIIFHWGVVQLTSNLIEGKFPPYRNVIPEIENTNILTIQTNLIKESIDRISSVSSEKTRAIKFTITENKLTLLADATENGTATESITVTYNGPELNIGFNAKYLLEALSNIEDESVDICFKGQVDPIRIIDKKNPKSIYVIMPMRI